jgi:hypothetical protein
MFLIDDEFKPNTPTQNLLKYLTGFGIALVAFDFGCSWLRSYVLPPRIKLPYVLRPWAAEDEFYDQDERFIEVFLDQPGDFGHATEAGFDPEKDYEIRPNNSFRPEAFFND